jgi:hypothetical protein
MNTSVNRIDGFRDWRAAADMPTWSFWSGVGKPRGTEIWSLCSFVLTVRLLKLFQLKIKIL